MIKLTTIKHQNLMKKLLLILFAFNVSALCAQLVVGNDSVYKEYNPNEQDLAVYNLHSTTAPPLSVSWRVLSVDVPTGWENDFFVCDAIQCWDSTLNANTYSLDDNKEAALDVHFLNNGLEGTGIAKILIWVTGDSAATVQTITYEVRVAEGVGIHSLNNLRVTTYPNPIVNKLNIDDINTKEIVKIELYNIIGKRIMVIDNPNQKEVLDLSSFNKGIYILKLTDKNTKNYSQNIIKN